MHQASTTIKEEGKESPHNYQFRKFLKKTINSEKEYKHSRQVKEASLAKKGRLKQS